MPKRTDRELEAVAEKYMIDPDDFGNYIHDQKSIGRKGKKNRKGDYTRKQLDYLAKEYLGTLTGKEKDDEVVE